MRGKFKERKERQRAEPSKQSAQIPTRINPPGQLIPSLGQNSVPSASKLVYGLTASGSFALFLSGLYAYMSLTGVINMTVARAVLVGTWVITVIGIVASGFVWGGPLKRRVWMGGGGAFVLALLFFGLDNWVIRHRPLSPKIPTAAEIANEVWKKRPIEKPSSPTQRVQNTQTLKPCPGSVSFSQTPVQAYGSASPYGLLVVLSPTPQNEPRNLRVFATSNITDLVVSSGESKDEVVNVANVHFAGKVADIALGPTTPLRFKVYSSEPFSVTCIEGLTEKGIASWPKD